MHIKSPKRYAIDLEVPYWSSWSGWVMAKQRCVLSIVACGCCSSVLFRSQGTRQCSILLQGRRDISACKLDKYLDTPCKLIQRVWYQHQIPPLFIISKWKCTKHSVSQTSVVQGDVPLLLCENSVELIQIKVMDSFWRNKETNKRLCCDNVLSVRYAVIQDQPKVQQSRALAVPFKMCGTDELFISK